MSDRAPDGTSRSIPASTAALAALPKRSLQLSAPEAAQLIRDAVRAGGELWVTGSGQSMQPTVRHADLVLVAPLRGDVRRGDVVLVPLGPRLMLHRVAQLDEQRVVTRGDARERDDAPVERDEIVARAIAVRRDHTVTPLGLTTRFGVAALVRYLVGVAKRDARRVRARVRGGLGRRRP
ncbi:MAG TPA: S24/S26 family peptidase [Gemmatimonadaceae bacterium]|nr:S24/S26 family peptidase [Gemmatimonadaceae bacterium]